MYCSRNQSATMMAVHLSRSSSNDLLPGGSRFVSGSNENSCWKTLHVKEDDTIEKMLNICVQWLSYSFNCGVYLTFCLRFIQLLVFELLMIALMQAVSWFSNSMNRCTIYRSVCVCVWIFLILAAAADMCAQTMYIYKVN